MSAHPAAERYNTSRRRTHDERLPPGYPRPHPTAAWPAENVVLLERYREWLLSSSTNPDLVDIVYIPTAGNALGLNLKPHPQLDLERDLERALDYVKAKQPGPDWLRMSRNALDKFRSFLRQERGYATVSLKSPNLARYQRGLPAWLIEHLEHQQHLRQANWRSSRLARSISAWWKTNTGLWRWIFAHHAIVEVADIKRQHLFEYVDHRLEQGVATSTINQELRAFRACLLHLQEAEFRVPLALLRIPDLKEGDRLPRFLTDEQVRRLRDDFEAQVTQARTPVQRRNALLNRAGFYLLWQGGLRVSEAEELQLDDLDLPGHKLMVRQGKGCKDRTVYLAEAATRALEAYLVVRGMGPSDHILLYHNHPLCKDLLRARMKAAGARVGVKVTPHALRHTYATQLLNAGCQVTTIQQLLGHRRLNSTMIYARIHDHTVAEDYYAAMQRIEQGLDLTAEAEPGALQVESHEPLLTLIDQLADPQLDDAARQGLIAELRHALERKTAANSVVFGEQP